MMRTMIQLNHGENYRNLSLPCTEKELQIFCDSLGIPNDAVTQIYVDRSHNNPQVDDLLAGKEVRLDELNFLMKRLDSLDEGEMNTFYATAHGHNLSSLKDISSPARTPSDNFLAGNCKRFEPIFLICVRKLPSIERYLKANNLSPQVDGSCSAILRLILS